MSAMKTWQTEEPDEHGVIEHWLEAGIFLFTICKMGDQYKSYVSSRDGCIDIIIGDDLPSLDDALESIHAWAVKQISALATSIGAAL